MATEEKLTKLIGQLLRKAQSTTPEEAQALTEHAERLMLRHGIDQARARAAALGRETTPEEIVTLGIAVPSGHYGTAYVQIATEVAAAYGPVRVWMEQSWDTDGNPTKVLKMVGYEADVTALQTLVISLIMQGRVAMDTWWGQQHRCAGHAPATASLLRRNFLVAFGAGAAERLVEMRRAAHAEAEVEQPGTAIALVDRKAAVDAVFDGLGVVHRKPRPLSAEAYRAGKSAGRSADVGGNAVPGPRRAIAG